MRDSVCLKNRCVDLDSDQDLILLDLRVSDEVGCALRLVILDLGFYGGGRASLGLQYLATSFIVSCMFGTSSSNLFQHIFKSKHL